MTPEHAWKIIGNQPQWAIKAMVKALSMCPSLNTEKEMERLVAAKVALRFSNPRYL